MNTHPDLEELIALEAAGYLPQEEQTELQAHLASCSACSMLLNEMKDLTLLLQLHADELFTPPQSEE